MQLGDKMIEPAAPGHAVLSQNFPQHLRHLLPAHPARFDQAAHRAHVLKQRLAPAAGLTPFAPFAPLAWLSHSHSAILGTSAVEQALFDLALRLPVVGHAAPGRLTLPVGLPAAEGTTQIPTPGIARIHEEENPAMPAATQAAASLRTLSENRAQQPIILQHPPGDRFLAVPVRPKLKSLRDLYCKKPRLSLRILNLTIFPVLHDRHSVPRL